MTKKFLILTAGFLTLFLAGCSSSDDTQVITDPEIVHTDPDCSHIVNIPDAVFKAKLLAGGEDVCTTLDGNAVIDTNGDGEIQVCEAENVYRLLISTELISSVEGILEFRNLQTLAFVNTNISHALDLSSLKRLVRLHLSSNEIPSLNVDGLKHLTYLDCSYNNMQTLELGTVESLVTLNADNNHLTGLNTEGALKLEMLGLPINNITEIDVSHLTNLYHLSLNNNELTHLDISGLTHLRYGDCYENNLQSINATGCTNLQEFYCKQNNLTELQLSGCTSLQMLVCRENNLETLDLSGLTSLGYLDCEYNQLVSFDMRECVAMYYLSCSFNPNLQSVIVKNGSAPSVAFDFIQCPALTNICCDAVEQAQIIASVQNYGYTTCSVVTDCF